MNRRGFFNELGSIFVGLTIPILGFGGLETELTKPEMAPIAETQPSGDWFLEYLKKELSAKYDDIPYSKKLNYSKEGPESNSLTIMSTNIFFEVHYVMWIDANKILRGQPARIVRLENTTPQGGPIKSHRFELSSLSDYLNEKIGYIGEKALAGTDARVWVDGDNAPDGTPMGIKGVKEVLQKPYNITPELKEKFKVKGKEILVVYLARDCRNYMAEQGKAGKPITEVDFVNYLDFKKHYPLSDKVASTSGLNEVNRRGYIFLHNMEKTGLVPLLQKEGIGLR